jgi:hypothetical protein
VILRCTRKVLDLLGGRALTLTDPPPSDDDWYLNLLWLDRRKCLLITHAGTLFSVLVAGVRKPDLRPVGPFVVDALESELRAEGLPPDTLGQLDSEAVQLAKTAPSRLSLLHGLSAPASRGSDVAMQDLTQTPPCRRAVRDDEPSRKN